MKKFGGDIGRRIFGFIQPCTNQSRSFAFARMALLTLAKLSAGNPRLLAPLPLDRLSEERRRQRLSILPVSKKFTALAVCAAMVLAGCGGKSANAPECRYIETNANFYGNGMIFGEDAASFVDFDTMEKAPLCAVPNCTHTTSECLAKRVGREPILADGYVYFFESNHGAVRETPDGDEFYIDVKLRKASLETSEVETVCEFHEVTPAEVYNGFVLRGDELYFAADDLDPQKGEFGGYSWSNSGGTHVLCCVNIRTGEFTNFGSIYDGDKEYEGAEFSSCANIQGVYKGKMYIRYSFIKDIEELGSADESYFHMNFVFDYDTKTWEESELPYSNFMTENVYTYYDKDSGEMVVIDDGGEKRFANPEHESIAIRVINNKVFGELDGKWWDLDDLSEHSLGKYADGRVVDFRGGYYIIKTGGRFAKITEEELRAL